MILADFQDDPIARTHKYEFRGAQIVNIYPESESGKLFERERYAITHLDTF